MSRLTRAVFSRDSEAFTVPDRLPVVPLRDVVVFPFVVIPLLVGRPASLAAIDAAEAAAGPGKDRFLLVVAQRSGEVQDPAAADLYRVGVVARLLQRTRLPNGTAKVLVEGIARVRVKRYTAAGSGFQATVVPAAFTAPLPTAAQDPKDAEDVVTETKDPAVESSEPSDVDALAVLSRQVTSRFEEYVSLHRRIPDEVAAFVQAIESDERRAIAIAAHLAVKHDVRQQLLEASDTPALWDALGKVLSARDRAAATRAQDR